MAHFDRCRTLALARDLLTLLAHVAADASPWAATFENARLLRTVRQAAARHRAGGACVCVVMDCGDRTGAIYALGPADGRERPRRIPESRLPAGADALESGEAVVVTITGTEPATATVGVEAFRDGLRHGWRREEPAVVLAGTQGCDWAGYADGVEVSALVLRPPSTMRAPSRPGARWGQAGLFVDGSAPGLLQAIADAEDSGASVVLRTDAMPDVCLARVAGASRYSLEDTAAMSHLPCLAVATAHAGGITQHAFAWPSARPSGPGGARTGHRTRAWPADSADGQETRSRPTGASCDQAGSVTASPSQGPAAAVRQATSGRVACMEDNRGLWRTTARTEAGAQTASRRATVTIRGARFPACEWRAGTGKASSTGRI